MGHVQHSQVIDYPDIADAVWTKLAHAANDAASTMRLMAVATVGPGDNPCNRMMVLRGANREAGHIWFHTDRRSPKIHHFKARPYVSALAYDHNDRVQVRIDGRITLHKDDAVARQHWEQTSMVVRFAYGMSPAPGAAVNSVQRQADPRLLAVRQQHTTGRLAESYQNFVVIEVGVEASDWLQVAETDQRRALLRAESAWTPEPFVP